MFAANRKNPATAAQNFRNSPFSPRQSSNGLDQPTTFRGSIFDYDFTERAESDYEIIPDDTEIFFQDDYYKDEIARTGQPVTPTGTLLDSQAHVRAAEEANRRAFPELYQKKTYITATPKEPALSVDSSLQSPEPPPAATPPSETNPAPLSKGARANPFGNSSDQNRPVVYFRDALDASKSEYAKITTYNVPNFISCCDYAEIHAGNIVSGLARQIGVLPRRLHEKVNMNNIYEQLNQMSLNGTLTNRDAINAIYTELYRIAPDGEIIRISASTNQDYQQHIINKSSQEAERDFAIWEYTKKLNPDIAVTNMVNNYDLNNTYKEGRYYLDGSDENTIPEILNGKPSAILADGAAMIAKAANRPVSEVMEAINKIIRNYDDPSVTNYLATMKSRYTRLSRTLANIDNLSSDTLMKFTALAIVMENSNHTADMHRKFYRYVSEQNHIYENNKRIINMTDEEIYAEHQIEFAPSIAKGISIHNLCEATRENANTMDSIYAHEKNVANMFFDQMLGKDKFYNIDAAFITLGLTIANAMGAQFVDYQSQINEAAELANKNGGSPLGEFGANFLKNNLTTVVLIVGAIFSGPVSGTAMSIIGTADTITAMREIYETMDKNGAEDTDIILALFKEYTIRKVSSIFGKAAGEYVKKILSKLQFNDLPIDEIGMVAEEAASQISENKLKK